MAKAFQWAVVTLAAVAAYAACIFNAINLGA